LKILNHEPDYGSLRWTVDTADDLELIRRIYEHFSPLEDFRWQAVLELMESKPELTLINAGTSHKSYLDVDERGGKS
jgi:spore coat polysaccharide biosynthesis protein SpsF (cytidylyltransferase family)